MKHTKKLLSLVLALVLALAMPVMAENASMEDHIFKAYQIFSGTQAKGKTALGTVKWGSGINGEAFLKALKSADSPADSPLKDTFADCTTAADVAKAIEAAGWTETSEGAIAFAKIAYANRKKGTGADIGDEITAGYYLVVDETPFDEGEENTVYNLALLQLTNQGRFEAKSKVDIPSVEKKVKEENDSLRTAGTTTDWQDAADYDIGDSIPFQLKGTLPENLNIFETYTMTFHDTQSSGLTFDDESVKSVKVYLDGTLITSGYTVETTGLDDDCTFEIIFDNVKTIPGAHAKSVITVEYTAKLNDSANIGSTGNPNNVYLEYSNNPNDEGTGKTTPDKVIVFTYDGKVNKIDGNTDEALAGAEFTLEKWEDGKWVAKDLEVSDDGTVFSKKGLDAGFYRLRETKAPAGYNAADDVYFALKATYDATGVEGTDPQLTGLEVKAWNPGDDPENPVVNDSAITEEKTGFSVEMTPKPNQANIETTIKNFSGAELPETGGMGTTIFYVIGGILVIGAAILLISKRRAGTDK